VDLVPNVVLFCSDRADAEGNLYAGPNTEDTPVIVEAAAYHDGIVIVQVNQIVGLWTVPLLHYSITVSPYEGTSSTSTMTGSTR
jgi:Malonate decarboxylase, alpha subunit, transporter/Flavodoxin-like fold